MTTTMSMPRVTAAAPAGGPLPLVDELMRDRRAFFSRIEGDANLAATARTLIVTILVGCAAFGGSMGAFRPGPQVISSAVKLPLVVLFTAGLSAPVLTALLGASGAQTSLRRDVLLVLATLALTSLVLAALAPVVLLAVLFDASYHQVVLAGVACCSLAGGAGLVFFLQGLWRRNGRGLITAALTALVVFAAVGSQMAWTLRPFVARPRADFAVVRSLEGSFLESVATSLDSARGVYHRGRAPLPGQDVSP